MAFQDGNGNKIVSVATSFPDVNASTRFFSTLEQYKMTHKINQIVTNPVGFTIIFQDSGGAIKRLEGFLSILPGLLRQSGAAGIEICPSCRQALRAPESVYIEHPIPVCVHRTCLANLERTATVEANTAAAAYRMEKRRYGRGAFGAVIGGVIGSVPWIIAYNLGWFVSWLGFLIGVAATYGYKVLGGRPGKARKWIVLAAVIISVLLSFVIELVVISMTGINELISRGYSVSYSDIPTYIGILLDDPQFVGRYIRDILIGLLFAGLGCFGIFRNIKQEDKLPDGKIRVLNRTAPMPAIGGGHQNFVPQGAQAYIPPNATPPRNAGAQTYAPPSGAPQGNTGAQAYAPPNSAPQGNTNVQPIYRDNPGFNTMPPNPGFGQSNDRAAAPQNATFAASQGSAFQGSAGRQTYAPQSAFQGSAEQTYAPTGAASQANAGAQADYENENGFNSTLDGLDSNIDYVSAPLSNDLFSPESDIERVDDDSDPYI